MKTNSIILMCVFNALVILSACTSGSDTPPTGGGRLNVVEALGLGESVRVEIMEFDMEDVDPNSDYIPVANINNLEKVEEIIFLLGGELEETPALMCIPEYRLRFWLQDGSQTDLGFSCQDAYFLTGGQSAFGGRQFTPPGKFTGLIESYLEQSVEVPDNINLLKAAEFGDVNQIEIFEQILGEGSAEVNSILLIEEIEVIEEILFALSGEFPLAPRVRCLVDYFITFTMDDSRTVTFGYMCGGEDGSLLRGDQAYFFDKDIHLDGEFAELFERLVNQEK
jgi:hypothetical protein